MTSSASQSCFVVRGSDIGSASVDDRSACHHPECRVAVIGAGPTGDVTEPMVNRPPRVSSNS